VFTLHIVKLPGVRACRRHAIAALLAWMTCAGSFQAVSAPSLGLNSVTVPPGTATNLALILSGAVAFYGGFNASFLLPRGVTLDHVQPGPLLPADHSLYALTFSADAGQGVSVAGFTTATPFSTDGILCQVYVSVASDAAPGAYPLAFRHSGRAPWVNDLHALGSADGGESVNHAATVGVLTIKRPASTGDSNGNGIQDAWEILHFGVITNVSNTTDNDGDGLSDYYEYLANTNPRDARSRLAIHTAEVSEGAIAMGWYSMTGHVYTVLRGTDVQDPGSFAPVAERLPATPPLNVHTDVPPRVHSRLYYRVKGQP